MHDERLLCGWESKHAALWNQAPICIGHRLHELPEFTLDALARLIESYPRENYSIIHMGNRETDRRFWREGDLGGLNGQDVISAIANGRLWLNLRNVGEVAPEIGRMAETIFSELHKLVPGLATWNHRCGILVSSPNAQVYYHADLPAHALFQLIGRKRVYFYPPHEPFIRAEDLEHIAIYGLEVDIPYSRWYDEYACVFDFDPGQMLYWPHTAPHRIDNYDCLNVSLTLDFVTEAVRRKQMVTLANGILRYRFGLNPESDATTGPLFWSKALLQKMLRNSDWIKAKKASHRRIEFRLDKSTPGAILEM